MELSDVPSPRCTLLNLLLRLLLAARCIFKSNVYPQNAAGAVIWGRPSVSLSVCQPLSWGRKEVAVADHGPGPGPSRSRSLPLGLMQRHSCEEHLASDVGGGEELLVVKRSV